VEVLARAMQLAHSRNVVHRDLKPANVLLAADGTPKITDFGLARQLDADSGATQAGAVMGTPSYMAPEQASGLAHEAGPAADVYALGAILYECLAGRPPFKGQTVVETLDQVRTQEPAPPSRWRAGVPLDLETICLKCLRKRSEQRYASAAELADDLARYQRGEAIQARPVGRRERTVKWVKRNPVVAGAVAVVVTALVVGATYSYVKYSETKAALGQRDTALDQANQRVQERDEANDNLLNVGARGLLLPLAAQVQPNQPAPPLNDQEVEPLWKLATATDESLRLRFVALALDDPVLRRRLTARAPFAFQAAVGLDSARRTRVEELLGQRLQSSEISAEEQEQVTLCLAHLGGLDRRLARRAADALIQSMSKSVDPNALTNLGQALSAIAARLEPRDAAEVAATIIQVWGKPTNTNTLRFLAQGLSALSARLNPREAAQLCGQAAARFTRAMTKTTNPANLVNLARCLSAVSARLEPKDAAGVGATLTQAISKTTDQSALWSMTEGLSAVSARLGPKEAAEAAVTVAEALSKSFLHPIVLQNMAQCLPAVSARVGPKEAAEVATAFIRVMKKTRDPVALSHLATGLSTVLAHLGPREASQVYGQTVTPLTQAMNGGFSGEIIVSLKKALSALSARLGPREAAEATATLTQAISTTTNQDALAGLALGLPALAARLEPKQAAELANTLNKAISKTTNQVLSESTKRDQGRGGPVSIAVPELAEALSAAAARLDSKEAAQVCGQAARTLSHAISKSTDWAILGLLPPGLSAFASHLEPKEAAEVAATLAQAMNNFPAKKTGAPYVFPALAESLSALAARLEPKEAAQVCGRGAATLTRLMSSKTPDSDRFIMQGLSALATRVDAKDATKIAATLTQEMSKTTNVNSLQFQAQGLSAVAARLEPKEAAQVCGQAAATLTQAMSKTTDPYSLRSLAQGLSALAARLEPKEAAQVCGQAAATLTRVMSSTKDPRALLSLAEGLPVVAARLEPKEAAELAATLTKAISETTLPPVLVSLKQSLLATAARLEPREAPATLIQAMSKITDTLIMPRLAQGLSAVLAREFPPQTLVDLLKHPLCVGQTRRLVLDQLGRHYHRPFADQWDFVDYAQQQKLDLDLTKPPVRFRMLP
jgi:hypothetical protein